MSEPPHSAHLLIALAVLAADADRRAGRERGRRRRLGRLQRRWRWRRRRWRFGGGGGGGHGNGFVLFLIFRALFDIAAPRSRPRRPRADRARAWSRTATSSGWPKLRAWFAARTDAGPRAPSERPPSASAASSSPPPRPPNDDDPLFAPDIVRPAAANAVHRDPGAPGRRDDRIALRGLVAPELLESGSAGSTTSAARAGATGRAARAAGGRVRRPAATAATRPPTRSSSGSTPGCATTSSTAAAATSSATGELREIVSMPRVLDAAAARRPLDPGLDRAGRRGLARARRHDRRDRSGPTSRRLRDEALVEGAVADAVPAGVKIAEVADLQYDGDAHAAAHRPEPRRRPLRPRHPRGRRPPRGRRLGRRRSTATTRELRAIADRRGGPRAPAPRRPERPHAARRPRPARSSQIRIVRARRRAPSRRR